MLTQLIIPNNPVKLIKPKKTSPNSLGFLQAKIISNIQTNVLFHFEGIRCKY